MTYGWNAFYIFKISSPRTHVRHLREKHKNAIIEAVDDAVKLEVRINFKNHLQMTTREKTGLPRSRGRFRHKALRHYERIWPMLKVVHNSAIYFFFSKFISLITQDKWLYFTSWFLVNFTFFWSESRWNIKAVLLCRRKLNYNI